MDIPENVHKMTNVFFLQETRSLLNEYAWPELDPPDHHPIVSQASNVNNGDNSQQ